MAVNFLEELRKEIKGDKEELFFLLKNNKEIFIDKLIDDWAKERVAVLKNQIMAKVQKADYSIIGGKRVVEGKFDIYKSIITYEIMEKRKTNKLLDEEIKNFKLDELILPEFKFIKKEKPKYRGFYDEIWHEHTLGFSGYAQKAIRRLEEEAKKETIKLKDFYITYIGNERCFICSNCERTYSSTYKFDGLYFGNNRIVVREICSLTPEYELPRVEKMEIEYSLTF